MSLMRSRCGMKCAGCGGRIPPAEVVRRTEQYVYHLDCFTCALCGRQLRTGDQFCLTDGNTKLVCKADFLKISASSQLRPLFPPPYRYLDNESDR